MPGGVKYAIGRGVSRDKVVWLPQGVDLERFDNPKPLKVDSDIAICFMSIRTNSKSSIQVPTALLTTSNRWLVALRCSAIVIQIFIFLNRRWT